jgi:transcriptional regulator with XRE-family HTH domain
VIVHGTITGYSKHRCTCERCRSAWRDYQRRYQSDRRRGELRLVDASEALRHIRRLQDSGMTQAAICSAGGLSKRVVQELRHGERTRIRRATAGKILGVTFDAVVTDTSTRAVHAQRLIDELHRVGIRNVDLERDLHIRMPERIARQTRVRANTFAKILCQYRYLARRGIVRGDLLEEVGA